MTESELEKLVLDRLHQAGIANVVDRDVSQFLWVGATFFAEIVLIDGSKQPEAERVLKEVVEDLQRKGTVLDLVVLARWQVVDIRYIVDARAAEGRRSFALAFRAKFHSFAMEVEISLHVLFSA